MKREDATLHVEFKQEGQDPIQLTQAEMAVTAAYNKTKAEMPSLTEQVFQLYSMLIEENARRPWTKIVQEQVKPPHGLTSKVSSMLSSMSSHGNPSLSV